MACVAIVKRTGSMFNPATYELVLSGFTTAEEAKADVRYRSSTDFIVEILPETFSVDVDS